MMTSLTLRMAGAADWPAIARLLQHNGLPLAGAQAHLAHFLLAEDRGRLLGVAGLEPYGTCALLRSVAVDETARGRGLAARLIDAQIRQARASGAQRLILLTTTAQDYFPRHGFAPIARDAVPHALQASEEWNGACPASALVMCRAL